MTNSTALSEHPGYTPVDAVRVDVASVSVPRPTEFLLPQIRKTIALEEFPFIAARSHGVSSDTQALRQTIHDLGPWEYYFEFPGDLTTRLNGTFNDGTIRFHRYRSKLISETLVELLGEDLAKTNVIDLACHCGAFSLDMAFRGAARVLGIELREKNLKQAEFLKEYYAVSNVEYRQGNVESLDPWLRADVVLCLGLLYHVVDPIDLLERCKRATGRIFVVDTICHKEPWAGFHLVDGKDTGVALEGTRSCELHPTYRGLIGALRDVGFREIVEVVGECSETIELYSDQLRRCLIALP